MSVQIYNILYKLKQIYTRYVKREYLDLTGTKIA